MPNNSACLLEKPKPYISELSTFVHKHVGKPLNLCLSRNEEKCSKMRINSSHFNRKYNTIYSYDIIIFFQEIWNNRPLFLHAGVFIRNVNKVCDQNTKHIAQLHRELRPSLLLPSGIQQCSSFGLIFLSDSMVILQRQTDKHTCWHISVHIFTLVHKECMEVYILEYLFINGKMYFEWKFN